MKKILGAILVIFVFNMESAVISNAANAGYLGDQLMNYIKAKYLAKKYNIPFSLRPFEHAEKLVLFDVEPRGLNGINIQVQNESQVSSHIPNAFYNISYSCNINGWSDSLDIYKWQSALDDELFMQQIKGLIALKNDQKIDSFPGDIVVAVHVRRPSNADHNNLKSCQFYTFSKLHKNVHDKLPSGRFPMDHPFPFKFLPHQYYIDQIKRIANMFPEKNIRIYIFTDSTNPQEICDTYTNIIQDGRISFFCKNNHYTSCVAEDLIALSKFDYLIRSKSNFSQVADFIGNHKIVVSCDNLAWYKNEYGQDCLVAETVIIKRRDDDGHCTYETVTNMDV